MMKFTIGQSLVRGPASLTVSTTAVVDMIGVPVLKPLTTNLHLLEGRHLPALCMRLPQWSQVRILVVGMQPGAVLDKDTIERYLHTCHNSKAVAQFLRNVALIIR